MEDKRITIFAGHYGSGKTQLAVNYALKLAKSGKKVCAFDMDIVNPYFKTADYKELFEKNGVELIAPLFANTNVEAPAISQQINKIFDTTDTYFVIDVGGDDVGAVALGRLSEKLKTDDVAIYLVVNFYRPLTSDTEAAIEIKDEIETKARFKFSGIINNSNLGEKTTEEVIEKTIPLAKELAKRLGIELVKTTVRQDLNPKIENIEKIKLYKKEIWNI